MEPREVEDQELKALEMRCPDCNAVMKGTGTMFYHDVFQGWCVNYYCPSSKETIPVWTPENDVVSRVIAARHGAR